MSMSIREFSAYVNTANVDDNQRVVLSYDGKNVRSGSADAGLRGRHVAVRRGGPTQATENNRVRQQFLDAVLKECGVKTFDMLPASVRKAFKVGVGLLEKDDMKLDANGNVTSGRPLTARRIRAVIVAVDDAVAKAAAKALDKEFKTEAARRSKISGTLKNLRKEISVALKKFREDICTDLSKVAGRMVFNQNPGGEIVVTDEDLHRYRELLVQHDGDSVDALYDLLEEKGVSKKNLKPRFAYPDVGRKPKNREEELQFSSGAPGMWNQQEEDLEENLKIDDVQDQIGSVMDSPRLKPAPWLLEVIKRGETIQGTLSRNFETMLEIQRLENSLKSAE